MMNIVTLLPGKYFLRTSFHLRFINSSIIKIAHTILKVAILRHSYR